MSNRTHKRGTREEREKAYYKERVDKYNSRRVKESVRALSIIVVLIVLLVLYLVISQGWY